MAKGTPSLIVWSSEYSVDDSTLDGQHQKIFEIINTLYSRLRTGLSDEEMRRLLEEAKEYAAEHFATEERAMYECGFPELESHKRAHHTYKRNVEKLTPGSALDPEEEAYKLLDFLKEWWKDHVTAMDKQYAPYLEKLDGPVAIVDRNSENSAPNA